MATFDERFERIEKDAVRGRGVGLLAVGLFLATGPFVAGLLLEPALSDSGPIATLATVFMGLTTLGLALSPIALVAGVIDLFWPRTCSCPPSSMQL